MRIEQANLRHVVAAAVCFATVADLAVGQIPVNSVIYDFDTNAGRCDPDDFTFFGHGQIDFGHTIDAEDGNGAYQFVDWIWCDATAGNPATDCVWTGAAIGLDAVFVNCADDPEDAGIHDAALDLSLGTGLTVRMRVDLGEPIDGTIGARVALVLTDADGTVAATPGNIDEAMQFVDVNEAVNRRMPLSQDWTTMTFLFDQLTWSWDDDHSVIGAAPGLDLAGVKELKLMFYRETSDGAMTFLFDEVTLVDTPPSLYFDTDADMDIDLADFAQMQHCAAAGPEAPGCESLDGNRDGQIDGADALVFTSCSLGPDSEDEHYPWCY